jgi:2,5-diamino-6-(ribosylamino)-4(3H)-pyrimidinone 5'-phosphate reductase
MLPFIHLNFALTCDARFAAGERLTISCALDWQRVHGLRECYDALAVGALTWCADAPRLSVRADRLGREPRRQPDRVIFTGQRACPIATDGRRAFAIGCVPPEDQEVVFVPTADHELRRPLFELGRRGVRSLLVEGGPCLLGSFLAQRLFDVVTVYVAGPSARVAHAAARAVLPQLPALESARMGSGTLLTGLARSREDADGIALRARQAGPSAHPTA